MGISPNLGWQNNYEVLGAFWAVSQLDVSLSIQEPSVFLVKQKQNWRSFHEF